MYTEAGGEELLIVELADKTTLEDPQASYVIFGLIVCVACHNDLKTIIECDLHKLFL